MFYIDMMEKKHITQHCLRIFFLPKELFTYVKVIKDLNHKVIRISMFLSKLIIKYTNKLIIF